MVWKGQGGVEDKGALGAATKLAARCIAMGGTWTRVNKMTDRLEFLVIEAKSRDIFEKSWSLYERRTQEEKPSEAASSSSPGADRDSKPKSSPQDKSKKSDEPKATRQKSSLDVALCSALQLKKSYGEAIAAANSLRDRVQVESGWGWAADDMQKMSEITRTCATKLSAFDHQFMTNEVRTMRIEYKDKVAELEMACNCFVDNVYPAVADLQNIVKKIMGMKKAADEAE